MYTALHLSPMIPSSELDKTVSFLKAVLEFELVREEKTYVILQKDNLTIHVLQAGSHVGQMEIYLEVNNLQLIWEQIKDNLNGIKFKEPFNQPYGMREIHLIIPMTNTLMFIGQKIISQAQTMRDNHVQEN